jgi:hypothetical protein
MVKGVFSTKRLSPVRQSNIRRVGELLTEMIFDAHQAGFPEITELKLISFWRERLAEPKFRNSIKT